MSTFQSSLLRLLDERGYIHQITDTAGLDALAARQVVPGYIGFDPTAPSLHVGHLVSIMLLRRLQHAGHKPIVLMGGGTGKIGDPSFKDEARSLLGEDTIRSNINSIKRVFERFLTFAPEGETGGPTDAIMLDNAEWLDRLEYIPFLRDIGQHFSVNRMLSFDSVRLRLDREQSLSFLEFNYMILQAYDFLELSRRGGCRLQMGGSDQWGNIVNGVDLARRVDGTQVFGLTTPLLTNADGTKMGKTVGGAVWLNEDQLPSFDYWQFWRNTDDRDVASRLRLFTDLPLSEIARLEALRGAEINEAKIALANAATALCRGKEAATAAEATAASTFGSVVNIRGQASVQFTGEAVLSLSSLPELELPFGGMTIAAACTAIGFTASNGEAKRKVAEGAVRLDDVAVADPGLVVRLAPGESRKLSLGRKKHGVLRAG